MSTAAPPVTPQTPPAPVTPTPPEIGSNEDFRLRMMNSLGKVVGDDGRITELPATPPTEPSQVRKPVIHTATLGEQMEEEERQRKLKESNPTPPVAAPTPPVAAPPVTTPPTTPAPTPRLVKKEAALPPAPAPLAPVVIPPPVVTAPAPPVADPDAAFISQLDADQQAEITTAEFAERKFPELKGKRAETLTFFRKVDEFAVAHPEATPEELDQFMASNRPKWKPGEKRRVEHAYITEGAVTEAVKQTEERLRPEIEKANKRIKHQEITPVIDRAVSEFTTLMSSNDAVIEPTTMEAMPAEVGKRISEVGYAKAAEEYAVEAPVYQSSQNAAREWLNLSNGLTPFNQQNALHSWLFDFVENQGRIYAANPSSVMDGKRFVPMSQFYQLQKENPSLAAQCYTFNDKDVLNLIAVNANISLNEKLKALEKSGFKREKKKPATDAPNPPTPTPAVAQPVTTSAPPSPISKPSSLPGAATTPVPTTGVDPVVAALDPDFAKRNGMG